MGMLAEILDKRMPGRRMELGEPEPTSPVCVRRK